MINPIDWNKAPDWANYHAEDECGIGYWYTYEPSHDDYSGEWRSSLCDNKWIQSKHDHRYNFKWLQSLEKRPTDV